MAAAASSMVSEMVLTERIFWFFASNVSSRSHAKEGKFCGFFWRVRKAWVRTRAAARFQQPNGEPQSNRPFEGIKSSSHNTALLSVLSKNALKKSARSHPIWRRPYPYIALLIWLQSENEVYEQQNPLQQSFCRHLKTHTVRKVTIWMQKVSPWETFTTRLCRSRFRMVKL